MTREG
jgi:transcription elongation factor GreA